VKRKIRHIINSSGKKRCDLCENVHILQEHHINGRDIPNPNHASNLANICPNCHADIHYGKIIIEGWILTTNGRKLIWHKQGETSFSGQDAKVHIIK
jgi:hypothetical protein